MNISFVTRRFRLLYTILFAAFLVYLSGCAAMKPEVAAREEAKKIAGNLFLEAKMAEAKEQWGDAIAAYTEALQYDPTSDEIAIALAKVFIQDKKIRAALYYTRMAIRSNAAEPNYWMVLQLLEKQEGRIDKAAEALEMYMKLNQEPTLSLVLQLADYYFTLDRKKDARKLLMSKARGEDLTASDLYEIAYFMAKHNLIDDAISISRAIVDRDPLDVQAWMLIGNIYNSIGREDEALKTYKNALLKDPENLYVMVSIANHCLMENDWECCVFYFEKAAALGAEKTEEIGIDYDEILKTLTTVYFYAERDNDARSLFDRLKGEEKDDTKLYVSLGKAMNYLERYEEAANYYRTGFEKNPDSLGEEAAYKALAGYVHSLVKLERGEEALNFIRTEAGTYISHTTLVKELEAGIYTELKQYSDAIAIYEWLISADPENRGYLMRASIAYDLAGQFKNAESVLLKVLDLTPDDPLALNNLAYMYIENDVHLSRAVSMVKKALKAQPENGAYLDTLGWAYYKTEKYKEARKYIEQALSFADTADKGIIFDHYGDVLVRLGKNSEAIDAYQKAIDFGEDRDKIQSKIDSLR